MLKLLEKNSPTILAVLAVLSISPMLQPQFIAPLQGNYVFVICVGLIILINVNQFSLSNEQLIYFCLLFVGSVALSIYWQDFKLAAFPIYFILGILGVSALTNTNKIDFVELLSNILLVLVIGALLGFTYAINGGEPLISFPNPNGVSNRFYLTTLSNAVTGNFIRPSGIFDEPGTFSFFICFVAAARHAIGLSKRKTWILIIGGLITFSLAHVVYLIAHALSEKTFSKKTVASILLIATFGSIFFIIPRASESIDIFFLNRLSIDDNGFAGDNRSDLLVNAFNSLDSRSLVFGVNSICITDYDDCIDQYGSIGENPLTPIFQAGILGSIPYYLVTISLFIVGVKNKRNLVFAGSALLLLQRPYVMSFGYAFLVYFLYKLTVDAKFFQRI